MNTLKTRLREFKLSGIYNSLDERVSYAREKSLGYIEFLELLFEDEASNRNTNSFKKDIQSQSFQIIKLLKNLTSVFNHQ